MAGLYPCPHCGELLSQPDGYVCPGPAPAICDGCNPRRVMLEGGKVLWHLVAGMAAGIGGAVTFVLVLAGLARIVG